MDNRPIGVFDSGLGGLSCVSVLEKVLPQESVIYFGDTARTPYGDKDIETIQHFTDQIAEFLVSQDIKMLVIACNTVSALCAERLSERYPQIPVVGIIEPTVEYLTRKHTDFHRNLGIIATKATTKSGMYKSLLHKNGLRERVYAKACPLFVPVIENGFREGEVVEALIRHYLDLFLLENKISTLVLGCTHYPFFKNTIHKLYPKLSVVNPSEIIVDKIREILIQKGLEAEEQREGERIFFASDLSDTFLDMIQGITQSDKVVAKFKKFKGGYFWKNV